MKKTYILAHQQARDRAWRELQVAPEGWSVTFDEPKRNLEQNAKFHAICTDLERSQLPWGGKPRDSAAWKVLLVSGHAVATKEGAEMLPGLEGEFVNLRESTALMSKARSSSLIEYALAFCAQNEVNCAKFSGLGRDGMDIHPFARRGVKNG